MLASLLIQVYTGKAWLAGPIYLLPGFLQDKSACDREVLETLLVCSARDGDDNLKALRTTAPLGAGGEHELFGGMIKRTCGQRRKPPRFWAGVLGSFFPWKRNALKHCGVAVREGELEIPW